MKNKLLIISSHSTFRTAPRGIQANRLINYLTRYYDVTLITSDESLNNDDRYFDSSRLEIRVVRKKYQKVLKLFWKIFWPFMLTRDKRWSEEAAINAIRIIEQKNIDLCFILSMPLYNADIADILKKSTPKLKLIGFFSDPISLSPYINKSKLKNRLLKKYEYSIFSKFDRVVFPSLLLTKAYQEKYTELEQKFVCIPHSYEAASFNDDKTLKSKGVVIRHIGTMNTERNPLFLLEWISKNEEWLLEHNVNFQFYGRISRMLNEKVKQFNDINAKVLAFEGQVNYEQACELSRSSDALMVIDANMNPSLFLPSKLVESLAFGNPVIVFTPDKSESARVAELTGNIVVNYSNIEQLELVIENIISKNDKEFNQKRLDFRIDNIVRLWMNLIDTTIVNSSISSEVTNG